MYDLEKREGVFFFLKNTKQTEQDNPCLWFPLFFLLRFPQEPGRYTNSFLLLPSPNY